MIRRYCGAIEIQIHKGSATLLFDDVATLHVAIDTVAIGDPDSIARAALVEASANGWPVDSWAQLAGEEYVIAKVQP